MGKTLTVSEDYGAPSNSQKAPSQATRIVELATDFELFHDGREAYASLDVDGHRETYNLKRICDFPDRTLGKRSVDGASRAKSDRFRPRCPIPRVF